MHVFAGEVPVYWQATPHAGRFGDSPSPVFEDY